MAGRVLIGGGSGFVGSALSQALRRKGYVVHTLTRTPRSALDLSWDKLRKDGLPEVDAVVNLSGANIGDFKRRWTPEYRREVYDSRVGTTELLVQAITAAKIKPKVWVSSSAVGYYGPSESEEFTEDSSGSGGSDFFSSLCRDWESAARLPPAALVRHVVIRIGLLLGRDAGLVANSFWPFFMGMGGRMGSGQQWFPWIHIQDVAGIFIHAIENEKVRGVLNATSPKPCRNREFAQKFGGALWRPAVFPMPDFVVKTLFGDERAELFLSGQKVIPKRTLESGYVFKYVDIGDACREFARVFLTVDEMQRQRTSSPSKGKLSMS